MRDHQPNDYWRTTCFGPDAKTPKELGVLPPMEPLAPAPCGCWQLTGLCLYHAAMQHREDGACCQTDAKHHLCCCGVSAQSHGSEHPFITSNCEGFHARRTWRTRGEFGWKNHYCCARWADAQDTGDDLK